MILRPITRLPHSLPTARRSQFAPGVMFNAGEQGAWYASSDLSTVYQDSAGTTAGAVAQPMGKINDKSGRGNHASQANSPSRPTLSGRYNGLVATEDFSNAAWTKANTATVTGTNTVNLPAEGDYVSQVWTRAVAVGEAFTGRMTLSGTGTIALRIARSGSGTYEEKITTPITLTATPTSHPVTHTFANAQTGVRLDIIRSATTATSVTATQADLRTSADASLAIPAYQRVTTATDYDTAGFPLGSEFDGTDDSLTASSGGGGTTGFFFCAAVRVAGGAGTVRDIWSDEGTNAGHIVRIGSTDVLVFGVGNGSAFTFATSGASLPVGETHVITVWDDGTNLRVQVDNGGVNNAARPAAVAGTSSFTVGKQNGAAARFFNGRIFSPIYRHGTPVTASSRERIKRYVAARAGVTL